MKNDGSVLIPERHVSRPWCVKVAVGLVLLGAVLNLFFLYGNCPFDLSDDECHYWEWSRHLDYGYYSKPPGIAWVIGAAAYVGKVMGVPQTAAAMMPVIRTPAVLFGTLSGLLSLFLARRMFRDDRAALMVTVLSAAVPMFAVGSLLITIDSPMYLSWAAAVYCLWRFIEGPGARGGESEEGQGRGSMKWLYLAALATSLGMLFKPVLIAVPLCAGVAVWLDGQVRERLKTWHVVPALLIVLLSQVPVLIWNSQHNWVTFRHIGTQGGFMAGANEKATYWYTPLVRVGEYLGGQAGGMAGLVFVLLVIAVIRAVRELRKPRAGVLDPVSHKEVALHTGGLSSRAALAYLLAFSVPLWGFYLVMNLWTSTQPNWPAASYFAGMVLLGGVCSAAWNRIVPETGRRDRGAVFWIALTVVWGVVLGAVTKNLDAFYPMAAKKLEAKREDAGKYFGSAWHPKKWDLSLRLKAFQTRADMVQILREDFYKDTQMEPLVVAHHYGLASSLAFHLPDQPFVYCIQSSKGDRHNQYDLWPGLNEMNPYAIPPARVHAGENALILGISDPKEIERVVKPAFERYEGPYYVPIEREGINTRTLPYIRAYGFKGLPEHVGGPY